MNPAIVSQCPRPCPVSRNWLSSLNMNNAPQTPWQRLEAEYATATPERREHIDELLDTLEAEAGVAYLKFRERGSRDTDRARDVVRLRPE